MGMQTKIDLVSATPALRQFQAALAFISHCISFLEKNQQLFVLNHDIFNFGIQRWKVALK